MNRNNIVSVVLAVHNEERFLGEALSSVASQNGVDHEVVLVDDNSTDRTLDIAYGFAATYKNINVFSNPKVGKCSAFNFGVAQAVGRFVCLFAGDDIMPAGSLSKRVQILANSDFEGPTVGLSKLITMSDDKRYDGQLFPRASNKGGYTGSSYLMNRAFVELAFPVPEDLPNEDTWLELFVTLYPGCKIIDSGIVGNRWRYHSGNSINTSLSFTEFNKRYSQRRAVLPRFNKQFRHCLSLEAQRRMDGMLACERARIAGNVIGVLLCKVALVEKLRSITLCNRFFYNVRVFFYSLFSGWR